MKPHEEEWEYISGGWPYDVLRKGTNEKIADVWATGSEDSHGVADLIAQAPAMARLLIAVLNRVNDPLATEISNVLDAAGVIKVERWTMVLK